MQAQRSSHALNQQRLQVSLQINKPLLDEESNFSKNTGTTFNNFFVYLIRKTLYCKQRSNTLNNISMFININTNFIYWLNDLKVVSQPPHQLSTTLYRTLEHRNGIYLWSWFNLFKNFKNSVLSFIDWFVLIETSHRYPKSINNWCRFTKLKKWWRHHTTGRIHNLCKYKRTLIVT